MAKRFDLSAFKQTYKNSIRVVRIAWGTAPWLLVGIFATNIAIAIIPYITASILGLFINELTTNVNIHQMTNRLLGLFIALITSLGALSVIVILDGYLDTVFRFKLMEKIELLFMKEKAKLDVATHQDPKFQDLRNTAEERGTMSFYNLLNNFFVNSGNVAGLVTAGIVLSANTPILLLLAVLSTLPLLIVEIKYGTDVWWIWDLNAEKRRDYFNKRSHFSNVTELVELKLFQNVNKFFERISVLLTSFNTEQITAEKRKVRYELLGILVFLFFLGAAVYILMDRTIQGLILIGTMTFLFTTLRGFQGNLGAFFRTLGRQSEWNKFVTGMFEIMDTKPLVVNKRNAQKIDLSKPPLIEFEDVWFQYPDTQEYVLRGVTLEIKPGEKLAVVGVNGAGKTTFVSLLCRFYDPTKGFIKINGVDLKEIDLDSWYTVLGVLFQKFATYEMPVHEAIAMGRSSIPIDQKLVRRAAILSEADSFIQKLHHKYNQMIGKEFHDGVEFSPGQDQKMALARLFYRDPLVAILDEPTASIDAEAEAKIFENFEEHAVGKTVVTISHRFSTVRKSDKICVIENGIVSELGTHIELMELNKKYAELFTTQAEGYVS